MTSASAAGAHHRRCRIGHRGRARDRACRRANPPQRGRCATGHPQCTSGDSQAGGIGHGQLPDPAGRWFESRQGVIGRVRNPHGAVNNPGQRPPLGRSGPSRSPAALRVDPDQLSAAGADHPHRAGPTVTPVMGWPTLITPVTAARSGSMRVSAPSLASATHSRPAPAAIADGLAATITVATTVSEPGFISDTVPLPGSVTQIPLPLAITPVGSRPTWI